MDERAKGHTVYCYDIRCEVYYPRTLFCAAVMAFALSGSGPHLWSFSLSSNRLLSLWRISSSSPPVLDVHATGTGHHQNVFPQGKKKNIKGALIRGQGCLQTTEVTRGKFISLLSRETQQQGYNQKLMCVPVIAPITGVAHNWTSSPCLEEQSSGLSLASVTHLASAHWFLIKLWKSCQKAMGRTEAWGTGPPQASESFHLEERPCFHIGWPLSLWPLL